MTTDSKFSFGSFVSRWIWVPLALVLIFFIYWGVWSKYWLILESKPQDLRTATGVATQVNLADGTLKLSVDDKVVGKQEWNVEFKKSATVWYYDTKTENGVEVKVRIKSPPEKIPELLKDGETISVIGDKKEGKIKATTFHIGGITSIPELKTREENVTIKNTADKLCIACVGLGESDMSRLWQLLLIFIGFMIVYIITEVVVRRKGRAA